MIDEPTLIRVIEMLQRVEWSGGRPATNEHDETEQCPICRRETIWGLRAEHSDSCELAALLRDLEGILRNNPPGC